MAGPQQVQWRGGPEEQSNVFIGRPKEITVNTTRWVMCLHDGITPGGHELGARGKEAEHRWVGTVLQFKDPSGAWGTGTDLALEGTEAQIATIIAEGGTQIARVISEGGDPQIIRVNSEGNTQISLIQEAANTQILRVETEGGNVQVARIIAIGDDQEIRVIAQGTVQVGLITDEGDAQVTRTGTEGDTQVARIITEGDNQVANVQAAAGIDQLAADILTKLDKTANAVSASKLETPRVITVTGDAEGTVSFDGSEDVTLDISNNSFINAIIFGG